MKNTEVLNNLAKEIASEMNNVVIHLHTRTNEGFDENELILNPGGGISFSTDEIAPILQDTFSSVNKAARYDKEYYIQGLNLEDEYVLLKLEELDYEYLDSRDYRDEKKLLKDTAESLEVAYKDTLSAPFVLYKANGTATIHRLSQEYDTNKAAAEAFIKDYDYFVIAKNEDSVKVRGFKAKEKEEIEFILNQE